MARKSKPSKDTEQDDLQKDDTQNQVSAPDETEEAPPRPDDHDAPPTPGTVVDPAGSAPDRSEAETEDTQSADMPPAGETSDETRDDETVSQGAETASEPEKPVDQAQDDAAPVDTTTASTAADATESTDDDKTDTTATPDAAGISDTAPAQPFGAGPAATAAMAAAGTPAAQTPDDERKPSAAEPASTRPEPQASPPRSAMPLFLGGIVAAGLGFGAAYYAAEQGWIGAVPDVDLSRIDTVSDALSAEIAALEQQIEALAAAPRIEPDDLAATEDRLGAGLNVRVDELEARVDGDLEALGAAREEAREIAQAMGSLLQRLEGTESAVAAIEDSAAGLSAQGATMDESLSALAVRVAAAQNAQESLRAEIAEVRELAAQRIEDVQAAAASAAAEADRRAALAEARAALDTIGAALDSGAAFAPALERVAEATDDIPAALHEAAPVGVATLNALQDGFDAAARAGLRASLQQTETDSTTDRLGNFLRSQIGARSLEPRDGADPDAVISRATRAVEEGAIARALDELEALPPAGQAAMSGWINAARTRLDAIAAHEALVQNVTAG